MLLNKHGKFENQRRDCLVSSHYSGSFDDVGIRAIFTDVLAKAAGLKYWVWEQIPDQQTGITQAGIEEMIRHYQTLHTYGCCAIGVNYTNPLIRHVRLPHDGSIVVPFKVSRESHILHEFFEQAQDEALRANAGKIHRKITLKSANESVIRNFLTVADVAKFDDDFLVSLTAYNTEQLTKYFPLLKQDTLNHLKSITALCSAVRFSLRQTDLKAWFDTILEEKNLAPRDLMLDIDGIYELYKLLYSQQSFVE